jgi:hypothetical protein
MSLEPTQPVTEVSTRNLPWGGLECKADNHTVICESIVYKLWEARRLTILRASTARYRDTFTLFVLPQR